MKPILKLSSAAPIPFAVKRRSLFSPVLTIVTLVWGATMARA